MSENLIRISYSGISRFLECRKKARLALDGWFLKKSSRALRFGKMFHAILELVTLYSMKRNVVPRAEVVDKEMASYLKTWEEENQGLVQSKEILIEMEIDVALISVFIKAYIRHHISDFNGSKKWISLEHKFEIPYRGIVLHGYIDGIYEIGKDLFVFETKTKGRINRDIVDMLHIDFQTFYYLHAIHMATGRFPKALVYNVAKKFEGKLKVDETVAQFAKRFEVDINDRPEFYFKRIQTLISKADYNAWVTDELNPILAEYKLWREGKLPEYCNTTKCENNYGNCDFLQICSMNNYTNFGKKERKRKAVCVKVSRNRKRVCIIKQGGSRG